MLSRRFGELESVVMEHIWSNSTPITVRDVYRELSGERSIAYTTVMSTMDNLHHKGWLERERDGKAYRYHPVLTGEQYRAQLMRTALGSGGRIDLVLTHFVDGISAEQSDCLRAALRRRRRT
ncbi:BlaI/MecI/CopY family transcriptional regulator [Nocardia concava]|uniref:BlaI/MecI/CopY family transcriptional regulator n=1 Tax=Nocardia concava TaxID=257281 RepID=UPI0002EF8336|nr:BlaI/MecI/CopY family transcriptional regulator [Nocardia concava]